jgi:Na+/proline symporter
MVASATDPHSPKPQSSPLIIQFARFWSSNMDLIHSKGQSWPGFSYTDEEKAAMHRVATATSSFDFFATMALAVVFTLIISALCVGLMFWRLNAKYGSDPSKTPSAELFLYLAVAAMTTLSAGLPLSILAASWITSRLFPPDPKTLPDPDFSQKLFRKATRQIVRMGSIGCIACLIYWLFVPRNSKLDLLLQAIIPMLGPATAVLSSLYYFSGRVTSTGPTASSETAQVQARESEQLPRP